jgi:23S rRNA U2552 (ribose-2'-O)-methylase RlmE/FtsJ
MANDLKKIFNSIENFSIKTDNYFEIYEKNLNRFIGKKITFVEIGVHNGGSLQMWKKYFGKKAKIIGIDINPECKKFQDDQIEIYIGDQSNKFFWQKFFSKVGNVDVVLDDGAHTNIAQIQTTLSCAKNIKNDGLLIIEDTHSSYHKKYNTSKKYTFINFTKNLIDKLYKDVNSLNQKDNEYDLNQFVYSINFYQSCVIFNINRDKTIQNKTITNNKKNQNIKDLTFQYYLNDGNNFLNKMKFTKNIQKIYKKYKTNKYLKKIFN